MMKENAHLNIETVKEDKENFTHNDQLDNKLFDKQVKVNFLVKPTANTKISIKSSTKLLKNKNNKKFLNMNEHVSISKQFLGKKKHKISCYNKYNEGRWSDDEHRKFIEGIFLYGNNWKSVEKHVKTRSCTQARSHAQKFFIKLKNRLNIPSSIDYNNNEFYLDLIFEDLKIYLSKCYDINTNDENFPIDGKSLVSVYTKLDLNKINKDGLLRLLVNIDTRPFHRKYNKKTNSITDDRSKTPELNIPIPHNPISDYVEPKEHIKVFKVLKINNITQPNKIMQNDIINLNLSLNNFNDSHQSFEKYEIQYFNNQNNGNSDSESIYEKLKSYFKEEKRHKINDDKKPNSSVKEKISNKNYSNLPATYENSVYEKQIQDQVQNTSYNPFLIDFEFDNKSTNPNENFQISEFPANFDLFNN